MRAFLTEEALKVKRPCFDVSLVYLTRKFRDLVRSVHAGMFLLKQDCKKTESTKIKST